jgi:enamine deaminase RidA (YjgF/YER057c/UK114 family)
MNEFRPVKRGAEVGFGSRLEDLLGFSRAVRAGDTVYVSGMTATDMQGRVVATGVYEQMRMIYQKIDLVLQAHGSGLRDVVKETWYARSFDGIEDIGRAHREAFGDVRPVVTGIVVELLDPAMEIEIDAVAVIRPRGDEQPDENLRRVVSA